MLRSLTIALPDNMVQNKAIIMTLNLYEKWDKTTLTAHLISASCAKNFGDWNSLALCLFTESEGTKKLVSDCLIVAMNYPLPLHPQKHLK